MFNKVYAPFAGTIDEVLVEGDGVIISKGQPLYKITPDEKIVVESPEEIAARRRAPRRVFSSVSEHVGRRPDGPVTGPAARTRQDQDVRTSRTKTPMITALDHIAIAVPDLEAAIKPLHGGFRSALRRARRRRGREDLHGLLSPAADQHRTRTPAARRGSRSQSTWRSAAAGFTTCASAPMISMLTSRA
jgi:pyruvate/2-oxoglutarate dehydrogenase complex dihydrolipoamide acyltransferase (E2) component